MFITDFENKRISLSCINYPTFFIRHYQFMGQITTITSDLDKKDATFIVRRDLRTLSEDLFDTISLESVNYPGYYLTAKNGLIDLIRINDLDSQDSSGLYLKDMASFEVFETELGIFSIGSPHEDWINDGEFYIRHQDYRLKFNKKDGTDLVEKDRRFKIEVPFWTENV